MIVEEYVANPSLGHVTHRYELAPGLLVGGLIVGPDDWRHLRDDLGVRSVLNVANDDTDAGKGVEFLSECPVPDDGSPFPHDLVRHAVAFVKMTRGLGPVYVHCALGNSRSPAFAYASLRWVWRMSADQALATVRAGKPGLTTYGTYAAQASYLASVESALLLP